MGFGSENKFLANFDQICLAVDFMNVDWFPTPTIMSVRNKSEALRHTGQLKVGR